MAKKNIVDTAVIHRTRYEIETFVLGYFPSPTRWYIRDITPSSSEIDSNGYEIIIKKIINFFI